MAGRATWEEAEMETIAQLCQNPIVLGSSSSAEQDLGLGKSYPQKLGAGQLLSYSSEAQGLSEAMLAPATSTHVH